MTSCEARGGAGWHYAAGAAVGAYAAAMALAPSTGVALAMAAAPVAVVAVWWTIARPNRWLLLLFAASWLLPPLPVAAGNSGPHVAVLAAGAGLLACAVYARHWRVQVDALSFSAAALYGIVLGSIALAAVYSGAAIAAGSFARALLLGITVCVFFYVRYGPADLHAAARRRLVRVMFWAAAVSALFACVDFYYQFPAPSGYGAQFVWLDTGVFRRAQGIFYEASTLGNFCAFFLVMIAAAFATRYFPVRKAALVAAAPVFAAALVLSYSRGSVVNVAAALCALACLHVRGKRIPRLAAAMAVFVVAAAAGLLYLFPDITRAYGYRLSTSFEYLSQAPDAVLSGRLRAWSLLGNFLLQHPWHALLGVGYKTLPYSDYAGATAIADNTYLSTLVEMGVVGLAALCALLVAIVRETWRAARSGDAAARFFGTWALCFWIGESLQFLSGDLLTYWRVLPAYFCIVAIAARLRRI